MTRSRNLGVWFKSTYSGPNNNSCIEARFTHHGTDVRDSKDLNGPVLSFGPRAWSRFLRNLAR